MVSTLVPVLCVMCGVPRVVCVWRVGRWEGWDGKGEGGGIDNGGWAVSPMCCGVFHLGCPGYTAKPMGRIVVKQSLAPSSLGVHPRTCDVCVCGVWCVCCCVCGVGWAVGRVGGRRGREASTMMDGCWALCVGVCKPWLPEIHGETYGPNSREIVVGAFVAWCPH